MAFDYHKCKANPGESDFVEKFKSLHPDFQENILLERVTYKSLFKYIVLTYDIESPFVIQYKDWAQRRRETAKQCDFPKNGLRYSDEVEKIILGKNQQVNKIILSYLFIQNDIVFSQYQSYQALYYRQIKAALEENYDNPTFYKNLKLNIEDLAKEIKGLETAIFHGDETKELKRALYDYAGKISLDFRPEEKAVRLETGEEPVDVNPYPDDYKPKKLTFVGDE